MERKRAENSDKKSISIRLSVSLYKEFSKSVVEKFGHAQGHIGDSVEEALRIWLEKEGVVS